MGEWLSIEWHQNTMADYVTALGGFVAAVALVLLIRRLLVRRLERWSKATSTTLDDFLVRQVKRNLVPLLYTVSAYLSMTYLTLPRGLGRVIEVSFIILVTAFAIRFAVAFAAYSVEAYLIRRYGPDQPAAGRGISTLLSLVLWSLGVIFVLDNLGVEVSAVLTGLGIGGIAVALASQAILGDLFSYFVIFFDRPFQVGDFLKVDDKQGEVEYIGIKTTRLRSLGGELLILSNKDLTNARVHNYKRMEKRRVVFTIGVTYRTPLEKLTEIPRMIQTIVESHPSVVFDRAHFKEYGTSSLIYEIVYFMLDNEYKIFMDTQQSINLKIFESFSRHGIEFAYPTQTLFVKKEGE